MRERKKTSYLKIMHVIYKICRQLDAGALVHCIVANDKIEMKQIERETDTKCGSVEANGDWLNISKP